MTQKLKEILNKANGQILLSQEAKSVTPESPEKFYRLYYLGKPTGTNWWNC